MTSDGFDEPNMNSLGSDTTLEQNLGSLEKLYTPKKNSSPFRKERDDRANFSSESVDLINSKKSNVIPQTLHQDSVY